ncbi:MAG: hypothetical protein KDI98_06175 [Hyphomicrobiaceae bacterium]|nr:hypothetical protein [Hyphomicrobiaceae bacterium]
MSRPLETQARVPELRDYLDYAVSLQNQLTKMLKGKIDESLHQRMVVVCKDLTEEAMKSRK